MQTATTVLVVGGTLELFLGVLLGIPMAVARNRAPQPPRYLFSAHLAALIQGGLLIALTIPLEFSGLSAGAETLIAWGLVAGMLLFVAGLVLNWLQGVEDAFGEGSPGNRISAAGTPLVVLGTGLLLYGVVSGL